MRKIERRQRRRREREREKKKRTRHAIKHLVRYSLAGEKEQSLIVDVMFRKSLLASLSLSLSLCFEQKEKHIVDNRMPGVLHTPMP